jgi:hypothetical protein
MNKSKYLQNLPKITFNAKISHQRQSNLIFLLRKVVAKKDYPVSCLFYD